MKTVKARITLHEDEHVEIPIVIPEITAVRKFADELHARGMAWKGYFSGWQAEYTPERAAKPVDSKMEFTPADFCIGESEIWFYSLMWENGRENTPVEFLDDSHLVESSDSNLCCWDSSHSPQPAVAAF